MSLRQALLHVLFCAALAPYRLNKILVILLPIVVRELFSRLNGTNRVNHNARAINFSFTVGIAGMVDIAR